MDIEKLVRVIERHGGLTRAEIIEAGQHGADAGWSGFTYTADTIEFYDQNEELVWDLLAETADELGESIHSLIGSFRTKYADLDSFKNLLSWFALEAAGHFLEAMQEERR